MYIDPSAGSLILQVIAAAAISGLTMVTQLRQNVVRFLRSLFARRRD